MKLSRACGYALLALAHLAREDGGTPLASHIIAQAEGIPERFLLKILKPLVTARIVSSLKGPHGGYRLRRLPQEISLLSVVEAVDGPVRGSAPEFDNEGGTGNGKLTRKLQAVCDEAAGVIRDTLEGVTIGDLVTPTRKRK